MKPTLLLEWLGAVEEKGIQNYTQLRVVADLFAHGDKSWPEIAESTSAPYADVKTLTDNGLVDLYNCKPRRVKGHGMQEFMYRLTPDAYSLIDRLAG